MTALPTSAVINGIVSYFAKKLSENTSVPEFLDPFGKQTADWVRPFFLTEDGEEQKVVRELRKKPRSGARQLALKSRMAIALEDDPAAESHFRRMFEQMKRTDGGARIVDIVRENERAGS